MKKILFYLIVPMLLLPPAVFAGKHCPGYVTTGSWGPGTGIWIIGSLSVRYNSDPAYDNAFLRISGLAGDDIRIVSYVNSAYTSCRIQTGSPLYPAASRLQTSASDSIYIIAGKQPEVSNDCTFLYINADSCYQQ